MSPYSTASATSSETAVAESPVQMVGRSGTALKAHKSSKKTPEEWSPELRQAVARDIDDFFGGPEPVKVKKPKAVVPKPPRADRGHSACSSFGNALPPPYDLPSHLAPIPEPQTIARHLFLFGFVFPPFWFIGASIILFKLRPDSENVVEPLPKEVEAGYSSAPSQACQRAEHKLFRHTELIWARRCLIAAIIFVLVVVLLVVATRIAGVGAFAHSESSTGPYIQI